MLSIITHMNETDYPWDLKEKQSLKGTYGFVDFSEDFLEVYRNKRTRVINELENGVTRDFDEEVYCEEELKSGGEFEIKRIIFQLYFVLENGDDFSKEELRHFFRILKKADLKVLKKSYDKNFINLSKEEEELRYYCYFSLVLGMYAKRKGKGYLQALSTMLKLNDFIIARRDTGSGVDLVLKKALILENELVDLVLGDVSKLERGEPENKKENCEKRVVENLGMFLQATHRSKAYLQNLIRHGLYPNYVILLEDPDKPSENLDSLPKSSSDILFNPAISEKKSLEDAGIPYEVVIANSCNDLNVVEAVGNRSEDYFVFSGRGILKEIFNAGKKIIHVHPGKLPEYRGSTCPYYSTLANDGWWCTSFIMMPEIDQGEIISQKKFPLPFGDIDPTRIYDPFTRSEALVESVLQLADSGMVKTSKQNLDEGVDYYVIHPVLEFIAKE